MSDTIRTRAMPARPLKTTPLMKRTVSYALLALVFFLLGFVPLWVQSRATTTQLSAVQQDLRLAQMQNTLGTAVISSQRGAYEPARQSASDFYIALQGELDRGAASAFSPAQQAALIPVFAGRDDLIALLARADPAAATRLVDLYLAYTQAVG